MYRQANGSIDDEVTLRVARNKNLRNDRRSRILDRHRQQTVETPVTLTNFNDDDVVCFINTLKGNDIDAVLRSILLIHTAMQKVLEKQELFIRFLDILMLNEAIPRILQLLQMDIPTKYKGKLLIILINISAPPYDGAKYINYLLKLNTVELTLPFLTDKELSSDIYWLYCNMASENIKTRDIVFDKLYPTLLQLISNPLLINPFDFTVVMLSFCTLKPAISVDKMRPLLGHLMDVMRSDDTSVIRKGFACFGSLVDSEEYAKELGNQLLPMILIGLNYVNEDVVYAAITCAGSLCYSTDDYTDVFVEQGIVNKISKLLDTCDTEHVTEILWCLSNIAASKNTRCAVEILNNAMAPIVFLINTEQYHNIVRESGWVLANTIYSLETEELICKAAAVPNIFDAFYRLLSLQFKGQEAMTGYLLTDIKRILLVGEMYKRNDGTNTYVDMMEEANLTGLLCSLKEDNLSLEEEDKLDDILTIIESAQNGEDEMDMD